MNFRDLQKRYHLPQSIRVILKKTPEGGYYAKLPDYPGCMTEADNLGELIANVTDAVLTYFDVPREETSKVNAVYMPRPSSLSTLEEERLKPQTMNQSVPVQEAQFLYYVSQGSYGKYPSFR